MAFRYTPTPTPSVSPTISLTPSITPTNTPTGTVCPGLTPTSTPTISITPSNTTTSSPTPSTTIGLTPTQTQTQTMTMTPSSSRSIECVCYWFFNETGSGGDITFKQCGNPTPATQQLPAFQQIRVCVDNSYTPIVDPNITITICGDPCIDDGDCAGCT